MASSQLYRALDRNHITNEQLDKLKIQAEDISKQINNFIKYLNSTEIKGTKYK